MISWAVLITSSQYVLGRTTWWSIDQSSEAGIWRGGSPLPHSYLVLDKIPGWNVFQLILRQHTEGGGGNLIPYQNSKRSGRDQSLHPLFYQYPPPLSVGLLPSLCSVHSIWGKYTRVLFLDIFSVCRSNQSQNYFSLHQPPARQETASFSFILAIQNSSCEFFLPLTRYVGGWGTITRGSHNEQKSKQFSTGSGHVIAARWPDGA